MLHLDLIQRNGKGFKGKDTYVFVPIMSRFLNRILGMPVKLQNQTFSYFAGTLSAIVTRARKNGQWERGIRDFGSAGEQVEITSTKKFESELSHVTILLQEVGYSGNSNA